jgi:hypothetical protein
VQLEGEAAGLAWVQGQIDADFILPKLYPYIAQLRALQLDNVPDWHGEPQDELKALEILDQIMACCRAALSGPPPAEQDVAVWPTFLSAADLAARLGQPKNAVEVFLRRYRKDYPDCATENEGRRHNEPRYLYRVADVLPHLRGHFRLTDR